jgi:signal transduction histidine kinase
LKYILGNDDPDDPDEKMTYHEYSKLITDEKIIQNAEITRILNITSQNSDLNIIKPFHYQDSDYLIFYKYSSKSRIKVLFILPVDHIILPIKRVLFFIMILTGFIILLTLFISYLVSRYFTRPIIRLTEAANRISSGNYNLSINIDSKNEIGILKDSFVKMSRRIKDYTENLETIIDERTRKIHEINQDLEEKNKFKSQYLANMSHEIRTPMNSILGFNQLLLFQNYNINDDVYEINEEMISFIHDSGSTDESLNRLKGYCSEVDELTGRSSIDLKRIYLKKLNQLFKAISENNGIPGEIKLRIQGYINQITSLYDEEEIKYKNNLLSTRKSGTYLLNLINSILDISKIESGKIELSRKNIDIRGFIDDIFQEILSYRKKINKENLSISVLKADNLPEKVLIDEVKIKEVMLNLLSNAVKFTAEGEVQLKAEYNRDEKTLILSVKDSGIGIKEEDKSLLFKEFGRLKTTENIEGTGLGLALSKKIIELHKGTIDLLLEYGHGSEFIVKIPVEPESPTGI